MDKFYITTAIDYPSGPPHIGHFYEKVCADTLARWYRGRGHDVFFSTGADEHGQKMEKYAFLAKESASEFSRRMSDKFVSLWGRVGISYNRFIRTTDAGHCRLVQEIIERLYRQGDIYKGEYEGLYCVDCEGYYLPRDLNNGRCPIHNKPAEKIKEQSYFFRMSRYQDDILDHIRNNKDFIRPESRRNEIVNRIKEGVRDMSISRRGFDWGVPLPIDKGYVVFVWFDALLNYISVLGYPRGKDFGRYWPADVHIIGKDILWFHAMVWPAMLKAAGITLPRGIFVHGFVNVCGEKVSKSKGAAVDLEGLLQRYGGDALRYFLLRDIRFGEDGDFSPEAIMRRYNYDLANDLGNLVYRTLTMAEKYYSANVPAAQGLPHNRQIRRQLRRLPDSVAGCMQGLEFHRALGEIWAVINAANKHIEETRPWNLAKEKRREELDDFMALLIEVLRGVAERLSCFMPQTAEKIKRQVGGAKVTKGNPLFPRIEAC